MKVRFLLVAIVLCLCLSACSERKNADNSSQGNREILSSNSEVAETQNDEQSISSSTENEANSGIPEQHDEKSQKESDFFDRETNDLRLLSSDEIAEIFSDLDFKAAEMLDWVQKDYTQISLTGVPIHEVENVAVGVNWVSADPDNPDVGGFKTIYGTATFAKVSEETLPGFPWKNVDEINTAITNIYDSVSTSFGLDSLTRTDLNDIDGIFYQFEDGLYFRTNYAGGVIRDLDWDYSSIKILKNEADEVQVQMYETNMDRTTEPIRRGIKKNTDGSWVLTAIIWG